MSSMPLAQAFVTVGVFLCALAMALGGVLVTTSEAGRGAWDWLGIGRR
jgi:hypothetical protein